MARQLSWRCTADKTDGKPKNILETALGWGHQQIPDWPHWASRAAPCRAAEMYQGTGKIHAGRLTKGVLERQLRHGRVGMPHLASKLCYDNGRQLSKPKNCHSSLKFSSVNASASFLLAPQSASGSASSRAHAINLLTRRNRFSHDSRYSAALVGGTSR